MKSKSKTSLSAATTITITTAEEDADLCLRVRRAGFTVLFSPAAEPRHALGRSMARSPERARLEYRRSHLLYCRKHRSLLQRGLLRLLLAARALAARATAT